MVTLKKSNSHFFRSTMTNLEQELGLYSFTRSGRGKVLLHSSVNHVLMPFDWVLGGLCVGKSVLTLISIGLIH